MFFVWDREISVSSAVLILLRILFLSVSKFSQLCSNEKKGV